MAPRDLALIRARAAAGQAARERLVLLHDNQAATLQYMAWVLANTTALIDDVLWLCQELEAREAHGRPKNNK